MEEIPPEELFRILVAESREEAILVLDIDGRVASWNAGAERITGYTRDEVLGRPDAIFYTPEDVAAGKPAALLARADRDGRAQEESWRVRKDGSRFWADVVFTPIRDDPDSTGEVRGYAKIIRDLTDRRRADEAIRVHEESLAVTLRSVGDGLIATDQRGAITLMNPVAERLTGWAADDARGRPLDDVFRIINEETHRNVESPVTKALREGRIVGLANHTLLIARDGSTRPIADSAAPIHEVDGRVRGVVLIFRDQTAERAAERALRESEERLRLLIEGVQEYAIFMLTPTGEVASWNPGMERIKGYRADEIIGRHFSLFYPAEQVAAGVPQRALDTAVATGRFEDEGWRLRKDGSRFWAHVVITALHDEHGAPRGFAKITRDLTERRAAEERERQLLVEQSARAEAERTAIRIREGEERLRAAHRRLDAVLGGLADGVTMQDRTGAIVYANLPAAQICGFDSVAAMLAAPITDFPQRFELRDPSGAQADYATLPGRATLATGKPATRLYQVRERASGRVWWTDIHAEPVLDPDGLPEAVVNIWHDVTAQRRREESLGFMVHAGNVLGASLDYEKTLVELARLVVPELADWCTVDILEDGVVKSLGVAHKDPAKVELARTLGQKYPPDPSNPNGAHEVIRTGQSRLVPLIPDELLTLAAVDDEHLRILRELGLRSGMVVPLSARGQTLGAISFIGAESGRIYDERDLAFAEDLGRRAGIAVDNARLYREAREAVRVRDDFLSIAGHELKTPLAAMLLQVHGLQRLGERGELASDPARLRGRLDKIAGQGDRLGHLVDELLDVSRIAAGRLSIERRPTRLGAIVRAVVERFAEDAAAVASPIELRVVEGDVAGAWDPARLDQVVTNLITNAVKYGRGKPIDVGVSREDGVARLSVRDRGIGIDAAHQARIFERFERAVPDRNYGGFGLGLWIARQVVEAHAGTIRVISEPGAGAEFIVELPAEGAAGAQ